MTETNFTLANGRYAFQEHAERLAVEDVIVKLQPQRSSRFLDIGCGTGLFLSALEHLVPSSTGIDSKEKVALAKSRTSAHLIAGRFEDIKFDEMFDRILIYAVVSCLSDYPAVCVFIDRALSLLAPGGRMLIGDIPNSDTRAAFLASETGAKFQSDWLLKTSSAASPAPSSPKGIGYFTSEQVLAMVRDYRSRGLLCYLLPQPPELPFGNTREDMLIIKL